MCANTHRRTRREERSAVRSDPQQFERGASATVHGDDVQRGGDGDLFEDGPYWLLYLPTVLGLVALAVDETGVLATLGPSVAGAVTVGLYWVYFVYAVVGTVFLYNDARALATTGSAWTPNPWVYVVTGAVGIVAIRVLRWPFPDGSLTGALTYLLGVFVVGCVVAASVTGPMYLWRRRRRVGQA
jgi:hypothetical protein